MRACLIAVDVQVGFLDDQRLEPPAGPLLAGVSAWLGRFRERGLPIVHVRTTVDADGEVALPHWDQAERERFAPGADGWRFAPEATPREDEPIVEKTHYSGFQSGRLPDLLREYGVGEVVVVGVHFHGCVRSTALDASAAGMSVSIGLDATASNDPPHAAATRRWMGERGFRFLELETWDATGGPPAAVDGDGRLAAAGTRAAAAFPGWSALEVERRIGLLEPLAALLREESTRLAETMAETVHKPVREGLGEVSYAAELAERALAGAVTPALRTPDGTARRVPHGPVLVITPWNNPVGIPIGKIVAALAHGNTVVWAPSPKASAVSAGLAEVMERLELPSGALERVEGGAAAVAALVRGGTIRAVSLSGSLSAGRALHDLCAAELIPLQAELGGNNAAVVCDDADVGRVADEVVAGAFGFAGQRCTATRRAIALRGAYPALADEVKARVERLRPGDPRLPDTNFAPVISASAADRLEGLIDRAEAEGARVWRPGWADGGGFDRGDNPPFVAPAVVEDAAPDSEVVREEAFGPVLVLMQVESVAEAIERCNEVPQGLVAAIHTRSQHALDDFARGVRAGILKVNRSTAGAAAALPFGGFGLSGLGPPEHSLGDAEFYTRWQATYE